MKKKFIFLFALLISANILSTPTALRTQLPAVVGLNSENKDHKEILQILPSLSVYEDSEDENQFYYVPPFRIFSYQENSATVINNVEQIQNYDESVRLLNEVKNPPIHTIPQHLLDIKAGKIERIRKSNDEEIKAIENIITYLEGSLEKLEHKLEKIQEKIEKYEEKLNTAIDNSNTLMVDYYTKRIEEIKNEEKNEEKKQNEIIDLEKQKILLKKIEIQALQNEEKLKEEKAEEETAQAARALDLETTKRKLNFSAHHLRVSGGEFDSNKYGRTIEEQERMLNDLSNAVVESNNSYAGYMSMNVYAGFTKHDLDIIYKYLEKMPHIKLTLLPAENFRFEPLTDISMNNSDNNQTFLFRKSTGSGDYTGSTLVFDLTLAGAKALGLYLNAFIVPISIKASVELKQTPFEATLTCDFSHLIEGHARGDVIDGAIIFSNDIRKNISFDDETKNVCSLKHISGSTNSALYSSLMEVQKTYEAYSMKKMTLAAKEAKKYNQKFLSTLNDMPKSKQDNNKSWYQVYKEDGFIDSCLHALSKGANFYWHTTKEDLEKISKVKFERHIYSSPDEKMDMEWPTRICLTFDAHKNLYKKCTEEQMDEAKGVSDATKSAQNSPECAGVKDSIMCGKLRLEEMSKMPVQEEIYEVDNILTI